MSCQASITPPARAAGATSVSPPMTRLLAIDADLSAPPSSPLVWRDVTLAASIRAYEVVAIAPPEMRTLYRDWMAKRGLLDYVDDILTPAEARRERVAVYIEGGPHAKLTAFNLHEVLAHIPHCG